MNNPFEIKCPCGKEIDITGTKVEIVDSTLMITFQKILVSREAFEIILKFLEDDVISRNLDKELLKKVQDAAEYLHLHNLVEYCDAKLKDVPNIQLPSNNYLNNMKWLYQVKDLNVLDNDVVILCKSDHNKSFDFCYGHAVLIYSAYFEHIYEETKTPIGYFMLDLKRFKKRHIESFLKVCYYKDFNFHYQDLLHCFFLSKILDSKDMNFQILQELKTHKNNIKDLIRLSDQNNAFILDQTDKTVMKFPLNQILMEIFKDLFETLKEPEIEVYLSKNGYSLENECFFNRNILATKSFKNVLFNFQ